MKQKAPIQEEEKLTAEEAKNLIQKYKRRFRFYLITMLICVALLLLHRLGNFIYFGWLAPLILFVFSIFAVVGYYGQYRTLEQKYFGLG
jgi:predicted nucleic acid-binding Zn ribbon protein